MRKLLFLLLLCIMGTQTWAIEGDKNTESSGLLDLPCYRFEAKLDGRIPVTIVFQKTSHDIVGGYIYYPKAKNPAPILIVGWLTKLEDTDYYYLNEYQDDGIITGTISLQYMPGKNNSPVMEGEWRNPKTEKTMKMTGLTFSREMPRWFTQSVLNPEDPGNIGREYSFQQWDNGYQSMMGGHASFRAAGKNKVHFDIGNVRHNIAEGKSDSDRPALLVGNQFEYLEVNGCHYGFRATFFPRFVVMRTITDNPSLDCFGMGAAFDGVYIKVKQ